MAKTKALISFAVTAKLICVFVFACANSRFSHDAAHMFLNMNDDMKTDQMGLEKISSCCLKLTKVKYGLHIVH